MWCHNNRPEGPSAGGRSRVLSYPTTSLNFLNLNQLGNCFFQLTPAFKTVVEQLEGFRKDQIGTAKVCTRFANACLHCEVNLVRRINEMYCLVWPAIF